MVNWHKYFLISVAGPVGFEPTIYSLGRCRPIQLSPYCYIVYLGNLLRI